MSDERLRELERKWRQSGETADEVAYLSECVRAGRFGLDRIELAALLGHVASTQVTARSTPAATLPVRTTYADLDRALTPEGMRPPEWIARVHRLAGDDFLRRLAIRACRRGGRVSVANLDALDAWMRDRTEDAFARCRSLIAGDAAINRLAMKLVVTWGGLPVAGDDVLEAACTLLVLALFQEDRALEAILDEECAEELERVLEDIA